VSTPTTAATRRRQSLLFLSTIYPGPRDPARGPQNRSLVEAIREAGCDVTVIAPVPWTRSGGAMSPPLRDEYHPTYWYTPRILRTHYHQMMSWSIAAAVRRAWARTRPDAVLAFWVDPDGTAALRVARRHGVPCGIIAAGSDLMLLPSDPRRRQRIARTLRRADHVFAVGSVLRDIAVDLGCDPARVSNFIAGVDLDRFTPGDRADARQRLGLHESGPVLLWVGQMVAVKAARRVLLASEELASAMPGITVALVGDGPDRATLEAMAKRSPRLRGHVRFAGAVSHDVLPDWYRAANVLVLPSRSEGVPTVLLEAMACGLPFAASDVGSIRDLLPFGASAVVPEGDVGALTAAITDVLAAPPTLVTPRRYDRRAGAREVLSALGLE